MTHWMRGFTAVAALAMVASFVVADAKVDEKIPKYEKTSTAVSGTIKSVGSDSMNNLMTFWGEGFIKFYPNVQIEIDGKGSATAPPALIAGTANFGPMSRPTKSSEEDDFEKAYGYKPTGLRTGIDMLAVYVHRDNPIAKKGLTFKQIDAIFSKTRKGGAAADIKTWGDLGLTGEYANQPISMYGRNAASGTYGYFKEHVLAKGDYKDTVKEQPGSSAVVSGVAGDKYGIGYSGIGYRTADVAAVPVAMDDKSDFVAPAPENVAEYPIARFLLVYVNYKPGSQLDALRGEFVKYVYSQEGQGDVLRDGYLPLSAAACKTELKKVGIVIETKQAASGN